MSLDQLAAAERELGDPAAAVKLWRRCIELQPWQGG